jgi:hypothetical protein
MARAQKQLPATSANRSLGMAALDLRRDHRSGRVPDVLPALLAWLFGQTADRIGKQGVALRGKKETAATFLRPRPLRFAGRCVLTVQELTHVFQECFGLLVHHQMPGVFDRRGARIRDTTSKLFGIDWRYQPVRFTPEFGPLRIPSIASSAAIRVRASASASAIFCVVR